MGLKPSKRQSYTPGRSADAGLQTAAAENGEIKRGANGQIKLISSKESHQGDDITADVTPTSSPSPTSPTDKKKRRMPKFVFSRKRTGSGRRSRKNRKEANGVRPTSLRPALSTDATATSGAGDNKRAQSMFVEEVVMDEDDQPDATANLPHEKEKERQKTSPSKKSSAGSASSASKTHKKKNGSYKEKSPKKKEKESKKKSDKKKKGDADKAKKEEDEDMMEAAAVVEEVFVPEVETSKEQTPSHRETVVPSLQIETAVEPVPSLQTTGDTEAEKDRDNVDVATEDNVDAGTVQTSEMEESMEATIGMAVATMSETHVNLSTAEDATEEPEPESKLSVSTAEEIFAEIEQTIINKEKREATEEQNEEVKETEPTKFDQHVDIKTEQAEFEQHVDIKTEEAEFEHADIKTEEAEFEQHVDIKTMQAEFEQHVDIKTEQAEFEQPVDIKTEQQITFQTTGEKVELAGQAIHEDILELDDISTQAKEQPQQEPPGHIEELVMDFVLDEKTDAAVDNSKVVEEVTEHAMVVEIQSSVEVARQELVSETIQQQVEAPVESTPVKITEDEGEKETNRDQSESPEQDNEDSQNMTQSSENLDTSFEVSAAEASAAEGPGQPTSDTSPPMTRAQLKALEKERKAAKKKEERERAKREKEEKKRLKDEKKREAREKKQREKEDKERKMREDREKTKVTPNATIEVKTEATAQEGAQAAAEEMVTASQNEALQAAPSMSVAMEINQQKDEGNTVVVEPVPDTSTDLTDFLEVKEDVKLDVADFADFSAAPPTAPNPNQENAEDGLLGCSVKEIITTIENHVTTETKTYDENSPPEVPDAPYPEEEEVIQPTSAVAEFSSIQPTSAVADFPSTQPTSAVVEFPSIQPTSAVVEFPSIQPTSAVVEFPSIQPTSAVAELPSNQPTSIGAEFPSPPGSPVHSAPATPFVKAETPDTKDHQNDVQSGIETTPAEAVRSRPISVEIGEIARSSVLRKIELGPRLRTAILRKSSSGAENDGKRVSLTQPRHVQVSDLTPPPRKPRVTRRPLEHTPRVASGDYTNVSYSSGGPVVKEPEPVIEEPVTVEARSCSESAPSPAPAEEKGEQAESGTVESEGVEIKEQMTVVTTSLSQSAQITSSSPHTPDTEEKAADSLNGIQIKDHLLDNLNSLGSGMSIPAEPESPDLASVASIVLAGQTESSDAASSADPTSQEVDCKGERGEQGESQAADAVEDQSKADDQFLQTVAADVVMKVQKAAQEKASALELEEKMVLQMGSTDTQVTLSDNSEDSMRCEDSQEVKGERCEDGSDRETDSDSEMCLVHATVVCSAELVNPSSDCAGHSDVSASSKECGESHSDGCGGAVVDSDNTHTGTEQTEQTHICQGATETSTTEAFSTVIDVTTVTVSVEPVQDEPVKEETEATSSSKQESESATDLKADHQDDKENDSPDDKAEQDDSADTSQLQQFNKNYYGIAAVVDDDDNDDVSKTTLQTAGNQKKELPQISEAAPSPYENVPSPPFSQHTTASSEQGESLQDSEVNCSLMENGDVHEEDLQQQSEQEGKVKVSVRCNGSRALHVQKEEGGSMEVLLKLQTGLIGEKDALCDTLEHNNNISTDEKTAPEPRVESTASASTNDSRD